MNNIFDTHAHYTDPAFDGDREELLASLPGKGVRLVMLASSSMEDTAGRRWHPPGKCRECTGGLP